MNTRAGKNFSTGPPPEGGFAARQLGLPTRVPPGLRNSLAGMHRETDSKGKENKKLERVGRRPTSPHQTGTTEGSKLLRPARWTSSLCLLLSGYSIQAPAPAVYGDIGYTTKVLNRNNFCWRDERMIAASPRAQHLLNYYGGAAAWFN